MILWMVGTPFHIGVGPCFEGPKSFWFSFLGRQKTSEGGYTMENNNDTSVFVLNTPLQIHSLPRRL